MTITLVFVICGLRYDHRDHKVKSVLIEAIKESNCDMNVLEPIYI